MLNLWRRRIKKRHGNDDGFTLVELIVTMMVISIVLLGLLAVQTSALGTVTLSRQRQQATDLANRTMEQLRALPYDVIAGGSLNTDPTLTSDTDIVSGKYRPAHDTTIDEFLVTRAVATCPTTASTCPPTPLYPHVQTGAETSIGPVQFTVRTYVTLASGAAGDASKGYWLTVDVTWRSAQTGDRLKRVNTRSRLYSPTGCLSTSVHPFSGPCQAYFDASAGTTPSGISISNDATSPVALDGNPLVTGRVDNPTLSAIVQNEQIVSTQASSLTSRASSTTSLGETPSGGVTAATGAATDPATGEAATPSDDDAQNQSGGTVSSPGTDSSFDLAAGLSDAVVAASTTRAVAGSAGCRTTTDVSIASGEVCSSGSSAQGGPMQASLTYGQTLPLASIAAASAPSRVVAGRFVGSGGPYCAATSGVGCIAADAVRSLGTVLVGGVPAGATGLPVGFSAMVSVTGYSVAARAESGVDATAPGMPTRTGTLSWWGGATPLDLSTATAQSLTLSPVAFSYPGPGGAPLDVTMSGTVTVGAPVVTPSGAVPCQPDPCGVESTSGTVAASVTYELRSGATVVGRFTVSVDLGAATAKTTYRAT